MMYRSTLYARTCAASLDPAKHDGLVIVGRRTASLNVEIGVSPRIEMKIKNVGHAWRVHGHVQGRLDEPLLFECHERRIGRSC